MLLHLLEKVAKEDPLQFRKGQVPDETLKPLEATNGHVPAMVHIQHHNAVQKGFHLDVRIVPDGSDKAFSWVPGKNRFPQIPGERRMFVRQPDHIASYATWTGHIPRGQKGHGDVERVESYPAIYQADPMRANLTITHGDYKGRYQFIRLNDATWIVVRQKQPDYVWEPSSSMKKAPPELLDHPDFLAEAKHDGHSVVVTVQRNGLGIVSRQKDTMGELLPKEDHVPHIRDSRPPKAYKGMVFRAELYHPTEHFGTTSSILLASPHNALKAQQKVGPLYMAPHQLLKGPGGKDVSDLPYTEQRALLMQFAHELQSPYVQMPPAELLDKRGFFQALVHAGGEGVVLKHHTTGEPFKAKRSQDWDLQIVGFMPGQGGLAGKGIGSFKVADSSGRLVGTVGTGLTLQMRQDAFNNPQQYLHRLIKVEGHEATPDGLIREPRFKGFALDAKEPDAIPIQKLAAVTEPPKVGDRVTVQLEKNRRFQMVAMGEVPKTVNEADGDPWDVIVADLKNKNTAVKRKATIIGRIHTGDGNDKLVAKMKGKHLTKEQIKDLQSYVAARSVYTGPMTFDIPGYEDLGVKVTKTSSDDLIERVKRVLGL